jgi:hypothetical protein
MKGIYTLVKYVSTIIDPPTPTYVWTLVIENKRQEIENLIRLDWWNVMELSGAEQSGVEWDGAEWNKYPVPLFGYFKKKRIKIEGKW